MEPEGLPLYTTLEKKSFIYRAYACAHFSVIIALLYYRLTYIPSENYWPWILIFLAELGFAYGWILEQAFRWRPVERKVFPQRLSKRFESDLPPVDIFICTADPIKEPPLTVINTVLSALAVDYPVGKLSCYVSDDGGSSLTFYALLEASRFAKIWLPFCYNYSIQDRSPEAYFLASSAQENENMSFTQQWKSIKKAYLEMKDRINDAVEMGSVPDDKQKEHTGFKDWILGSSRRDHPSIVQILLENGEDKDIQGNDLPDLIYVSREKRPGIPHHYKAGALNALIRISGLMSNAPFILTLDCDMCTNNCEALRQAMCFFMDPQTGHQFAYVQFPQGFHGITRNDLYGNDHLRVSYVGMIYGCAVEDALTGFVIQCRGWKSIYCTPRRKAFLGGAPLNMNDTLIQIKRWSAGYLEFLFTRFCPCVYGIQRISITHCMCYGVFCLWAPSSLYILCYGLLPALAMFNGLSLFPKASNPWFILFVSLAGSAYGYSLIEFVCIGGSFKSWWNEQRMYLIKGVSSYLFALIQVACKMLGLSEVGFEVTSKVVDSEAAKRHEEEMFEFGVASAMFVPPATLAVINLISLVSALAKIMREGYEAFESMVLQIFLCTFIVINSYPILEAMFMRKDKGRIPTSITVVAIFVAVSACSVSSTLIPTC